jgi:predicted branched-subunit amino acid permease
MRQHLGGLPLRWRLLASNLVADNAYAVCIARFTEHPDMRGKLWYFLGVAIPVWLTWQLAVLAGAAMGAGLPAAWQLDFAAPLAGIAAGLAFERRTA